MIPRIPVLVLCAAVAAPLAAQGVVMVSDLKGEVFLEGRNQPVALMQEVAANQGLVFKAGGRATFVNMKTGVQTSFEGPGTVRFDAQGEAKGLATKDRHKVTALGGVLQLKPAAMAQASVVMRNTAEKVDHPMSPWGPWVLSPVPAFAWKPAGPKASYHFKFKDAQGQVVFELTQGDCTVQVPEHLALAEDAEYTWMLETTLPDGSQTNLSGQLKLVPKAVREQLERARPKAEAPFSERLVYAVLLEQQDLREEAQAWWKALAKERQGEQGLSRLAGE